MATGPYDYGARHGVRSISWVDYHSICKALSAAVYPFRPEMILPVVRGGLYPGALMAQILQIDICPIRLSRRVADAVKHSSPRWTVEPPGEVRGRRVLIVDEICDTRETLETARRRIAAMRALEVKGAVLYAHPRGAAAADYIGIITDELILNPWDREIYRDGRFRMHPEYSGALAKQGTEPSDSFLLPTAEVILAKGAP